MTSQKALNTQIKRLFRLPFAPSDAEDIAAVSSEFRRALSRCASDVHLEAVTNRAVETLPRFPAPAEIFTLVAEIPDPAVMKAPSGCEECGGSGWRIVGENTADYCICDRGRWMRAAHRKGAA